MSRKRARLTATKSMSPSSPSMREDLAEFARFFVEFGEDAFNRVPVEADAGGFAGQLKGFEEGGKSVRDAVEDRRRFLRGESPLFCSVCDPGAKAPPPDNLPGLPLLLFDDFPVAQDLGGVFGALFAEDVGVAADHFFVDFADHVGDREARFFAGNLGMEKHLEQKVAQFFGQLGVVGGIEGVEDFVGFLDEVGAKGRVGLLAVPRATARSAETVHDGDQFVEGGAYARGRKCGSCFASGFVGTTMGLAVTLRLDWHVRGTTLAVFGCQRRQGPGHRHKKRARHTLAAQKKAAASGCRSGGLSGGLRGGLYPYTLRTTKTPARARKPTRYMRIEGGSGVAIISVAASGAPFASEFMRSKPL